MNNPFMITGIVRTRHKTGVTGYVTDYLNTTRSLIHLFMTINGSYLNSRYPVRFLEIMDYEVLLKMSILLKYHQICYPIVLPYKNGREGGCETL